MLISFAREMGGQPSWHVNKTNPAWLQGQHSSALWGQSINPGPGCVYMHSMMLTTKILMFMSYVGESQLQKHTQHAPYLKSKSDYLYDGYAVKFTWWPSELHMLTSTLFPSAVSDLTQFLVLYFPWGPTSCRMVWPHLSLMLMSAPLFSSDSTNSKLILASSCGESTILAKCWRRALMLSTTMLMLRLLLLRLRTRVSLMKSPWMSSRPIPLSFGSSSSSSPSSAADEGKGGVFRWGVKGERDCWSLIIIKIFCWNTFCHLLD